MKFTYGAVITMLVASLAMSTSGYKILGVFHTMAKSHWILGSSLMKGLSNAGHEVTVISPFPVNNKNIKQVELSGIFDIMKNKMDHLLDMHDQSVIEMITNVYDMGLLITNFTLVHPGVQNFLNSGEQFDLVIVESFLNEAMVGFGQHFKAPVIMLSTFGASKWTNDFVGTPAPLSYIPHTFLSFTDRMTFLQRIGNTLMTAFEMIYMNIFYYPKQKALYDNNFPGPKLDYESVMQNVSLVLLNSHFSLSHPRPYMPNMIEVGGMHINRKPKPLPEDLQNYLDNSTHGVIYFSMGSNIRSTTLPVEKRDALIKVFNQLKQNVMWKWEDTTLPGKPSNVFIKDWFPQDDILAHPNVKLFITHGGLLGTSEAIFHGVPVIGIPIFGDQKLNMARAQRSEYGLMVDYQNLTETSLLWALREMLGNDKYTKNAKIISSRYRDQPKLPMDTAIYWVEYVARHKGAPHLHCAGVDMNWIVYHNLDVFSLLGIILFLFAYLVFKFFKVCFWNTPRPIPAKKNKKHN